MPHPVRGPALPARAAEAREGGGGQPEGEGRVQGGQPAGVGRLCRCKGAVVGPGPAPTRLWAARSVAPLSPGAPPSHSPRPGGGGGGGADGARPGRTCAPSRAGESPGEHVPWRAGGGESRERLHCCCCRRRGRRCLFLPPEPSPPRPGRGAPRAELSRARRSRRRAPQAAAAAATVVAAARAGKLCPFVRAAPEAAGRSVQSVPFRLRDGGGAAGRHGGPGPGGGDGPGARVGAATLLRGMGRGCYGSQCSGAGRGRRGGAGAAEPPEPSGRGPRTKEPERRRARGPARAGARPPLRVPLAERAALPGLASGRGSRRCSQRALPRALPPPFQAASVLGAPGQPRRVQLSANFILKALFPWGGPSDLQ